MAVAALVAFSALLAASGCSAGGGPGGGVDSGNDAARADGGGKAEGGHTDTLAECGAPMPEASPFPIAPHPALPQVEDHGGRLLKTPVATSVTFAGYDRTKEVEQLVQTLGSTSYWAAVTSEYGIGPLKASRPVELAEHAPATIDQTQIPGWLAGRLDGSHAEFGTPTPESIYVLFYPSSTKITDKALDAFLDAGVFDAGTIDGGTVNFDSCNGFFGYHSSVTLTSGPWAKMQVVFAVVTECGALKPTPTEIASHELVESTTDPLVPSGTYTGWGGLDTDHFAWSVVPIETELADLCAPYPSSDFQPACYPFHVQRSWSNFAASHGHDPCQPTSDVYFNAAPALVDDVTAIDVTTTIHTKGALIPIGQQKTVEVDLFSDGPMPDWTVSADDLSSVLGGGPYLTFAFDKTTGKNGDKLHLTITPVMESATYASEPFEIVSTSGARTNVFYGLVSQH